MPLPVRAHTSPGTGHAFLGRCSAATCHLRCTAVLNCTIRELIALKGARLTTTEYIYIYNEDASPVIVDRGRQTTKPPYVVYFRCLIRRLTMVGPGMQPKTHVEGHSVAACFDTYCPTHVHGRCSRCTTGYGFRRAPRWSRYHQDQRRMAKNREASYRTRTLRAQGAI